MNIYIVIAGIYILLLIVSITGYIIGCKRKKKNIRIISLLFLILLIIGPCLILMALIYSISNNTMN